MEENKVDFLSQQQRIGYDSLKQELLQYKELMTIKEVANYLHVSLSTIYLYTKKEQLPVKKISERKTFILKNDFIFWLLNKNTKKERKI